jgi:hypothetical protein
MARPKQREVHLSGGKQFRVFLEHGFSPGRAKELSDITELMSFEALDNLYRAIGIIRKGDKNDNHSEIPRQMQ